MILRRDRPADRRDKLLLIYAARHYRDLSAKNQLRPQDVMRIMVHYQAYGDATKVPSLVETHRTRLEWQIAIDEENELALIAAEYQRYADAESQVTQELADARGQLETATSQTARKRAEARITKLEKQHPKVLAKLAERDARIADYRRRAAEDRRALLTVGDELVQLYADPEQLIKHARVVSQEEIEDNEFNLNIPRYVDTFEPEPVPSVRDAQSLRHAQAAATDAEADLADLLAAAGYDRSS